MAGGLLSLISEGQQSIILYGNPSKTFFKSTYSKITNFGMQKFRVDYEGARTLQLTDESTFTFKIPRYADLLMDSYISIDMPNIWSPIYPPTPETGNKWAPYEFKWIENLGTKMISRISITCGNQKLQEFSGDFLQAQIERDLNGTKRLLLNAMSGGNESMNNPGNSGSRVNSYPNAFYTESNAGPEPSIRGRTIYIPLNAWFCNKTQRAFPLIALQYNELHIHITFRPINQLFTIRDVFDPFYNYPYVAPNFNLEHMQMYRFVQPPPDITLAAPAYIDKRAVWNANIHLNCTYCFLSNDESRLFAANEQKYIFKQVHETIFYNVTGPNKVQLDSLGLVSDYLFYFQRSDANLRNEWSNYTNWPYNYLPSDLTLAPTDGSYNVVELDTSGNPILVPIGPGVNPDGYQTGLMLTGDYNSQNTRGILQQLGILFDGEYRENMQPEGVYNYIEKYIRTPGFAPFGLYCYNYSMNTGALFSDNQPAGATNMNRFNQIELEFNTTIPVLDPLAQVLTICDPNSGEIIGINKPTWRIYDYNFDLHFFEERINMITFVGGNCGLMYAT
jgi:hypothetical protein